MTEQEFKNFFALGLCVNGVARRKPVAYLYNGVRLPKLPDVPSDVGAGSWDSAVIFKDGEVYNLWFGNAPFELYQGGVATTTQGRLWWKYSAETNEWVWVNGVSTGSNYKNAPPVWCNQDLLGYDGSVYLAASEPIPVYE
jgi:hypothetical protein